MSKQQPFYIGKEEQIKYMYLAGLCADEIHEKLALTVTVRALNRFIKSLGITRSRSEHRMLSIKTGRMKFAKSPVKIARKTIQRKMRFMILARDNFRCVLCGVDAKSTRLQIDHKDEDKTNNNMNNLQTLCEECNRGKYYVTSS